jgi:hypothetical protein
MRFMQGNLISSLRDSVRDVAILRASQTLSTGDKPLLYYVHVVRQCASIIKIQRMQNR